MFHYLKKTLRNQQIRIKNTTSEDKGEKSYKEPLSSDLKQNMDRLSAILGDSTDIITREFKFGYQSLVNAAIVFVDGLTDKDVIDKSIMKPLMYDVSYIPKKEPPGLSDVQKIKSILLSVNDVQSISCMNQLLDNLLSGNTILLIEGPTEALVISAKKWETRAIEIPQTENVVRGPKEGFTETLRTNTSLIRRKIRHPDLRLETVTIGEKTRTIVCIVYIKGIADPKLVMEIKKRLGRIKIDAVLESGYIEAFIEDAPYSVFSTVANSEKPDAIAAKILEGRAAILVDGTPVVLTVPMLFLESFQTPEDYYSRPYFASITRILRFLAYLISILSPSVYVALSTFHQELIPTQLLFTMAAGHEGVPFPAIAEATMMMIIFDILREAGIRLPRTVGSAVSIVGALVIGEATVSAGLISPIMVIVVAITAISSFVIPPQTDSSSILRYFLLFLAGFMGGFGILMGLLVVIIHVVSLRSFGTPYMSPLAPLTLADLKDSFIRMPVWSMQTRPRAIGWQNLNRQESARPPSPPDKKRGG